MSLILWKICDDLQARRIKKALSLGISKTSELRESSSKVSVDKTYFGKLTRLGFWTIKLPEV